MSVYLRAFRRCTDALLNSCRIVQGVISISLSVDLLEDVHISRVEIAENPLDQKGIAIVTLLRSL
jgi:hypothetical protein